MIAIPAIDLRDGACVQLVGGAYDAERVRLDDPAAVARDWVRAGFQRLHVVDLDAATGRGSNAAVIEELLREVAVPVQVGGGVRSAERVEALLELGAARVVVGTRALEEPDWLAELAHDFPGVLVVAADVRGRRVTTRGWARTLPRDIVDTVEELAELPLAAVMVTAVHKEGQMQGPDYFLVEDVVEASRLPVYASGGIAGARDLRELAERGVAAAVLGMALYTGALDPQATAAEFGA
ncbi:MAG TPA: 1-(5-phosphoribosyl)-5-[(5-phosphoribosylamino)methylideneamino]imidazole-4-carboxamide isomerase [Gemmatimonadaceae bacterium]|nr:1-(5-phosphoribosyl)-5-[(5-phosphoribosylamino)methylideneamino]imidazole-4-carboxamide isomerase [Gemmatimonadaceae bacterium]